MTRHDARLQAFELVFAAEFLPDEPLPELIADASQARDLAVDPYAEKAADACLSHLAEIDAAISAHSDKWRIERLPRATLAILRLAVAEIRFLGEPAGAMINEAVELAKEFCGDEDPAYVNGVLGGIVNVPDSTKE